MTSLTAEPITHRERELGAIIRAYNEVTDRLKTSHDRLSAEVRRLQEKLDEKNRELARRERLAALGEMAAGVAHEIRNPLAGIQLYASLLMRDVAGGPRELAEKISAGVQSLEAVVSGILDFAGQKPLDPRPLRLADVVQVCIEWVQPLRASRRIELHADAGIESVELVADEGQLRRALLNLLRNAIEAAAGNVWIRAEVDSPGGGCTLVISDDGPGIGAELLHKVFNPFFTTKHTGTGLGLSIVHRIAEAHGGWVRAAQRTGGGAELHLSLPGLGAGQRVHSSERIDCPWPP